MWGKEKKLLRPLRQDCNIMMRVGKRHAWNGDKSLIAVNIVHAAFTIRGGFNTSVRGISPESSFRVISN